MKNRMLIPVFFLISLLAQARSVPPVNDATDCTQAFFQALLDQDAATLRRLMTFDFVLVGPDGRMLDGGTFSESVASGSVKIEQGSLSGTTTRTYGEAGMVIGFWNARGMVQGYRFDHELAFSALCVRQGGSWKIASLQLTAKL